MALCSSREARAHESDQNATKLRRYSRLKKARLQKAARKARACDAAHKRAKYEQKLEQCHFCAESGLS